ncbi:MAG: hypothetical protein GY836_11035 [Herbaspirillum sp.]|uniref:hypothetical protein n=1 Tax=Herbaspirillum sp. TaxID=1890675 RepID=UPI0025886DB7|nr:hypothetical protein [Herbaspirillum sp.]MCP4555947.1 hypothetical protein [Herbaspirillum sp.]
MIVVSLISLAGMVLLFALNNSTWFKKENFKIQKKIVMDENRIKLKKLEKEMGIVGGVGASYQEPKSMLETGGNLLDVLKNLDGEQVKGLADKFLKPEDEAAGYDMPPPSTIDSLLDFASNNPEIAQEFLKGVTKKKDDSTEKVFN